MQAQQSRRCRIGVCPTLLILALALFLTFLAGATAASGKPAKPDKWWEVTPEEEVPSPFYDSILYSEIAPRLREIQKSSRQLIQVEVIGQSAGGRNLFLVTIARPGDEGRFGHYKNLRRLMTRDPDQALAAIDRFEDFKIPLFLNCSVHGDEYPGTDACMRLIEQLAYEDSPEVQAVLDNVILLINVVMNPDGRVLGTRANANGFDINRDMITQSQPESRATVKVVADWNPMVVLDLHGFFRPMIIEPCTPPHNPNYEYDLYLAWALSLAFAMEDELIARTGETGATIPYLEWPDAWDDWVPVYANSYAMLHGAYGLTLETPHRHEGGVDTHFAAVWGALKFVVDNKKEMIRDQIEVYRRGALDLPQVLIPEELLAQTPWEQYNELTIQDFPEAYLIPAAAPLQQNPVQAAELVDFLLYNGVQVEKAKRAFSVDGRLYPGGTYVVWMDQPKRSLANVILEDGLDLSFLAGITFYGPPVAWSHPLLWGVSRTVVNEAPAISTVVVKQAELPSGTLEAGWAAAHAVTPDTLQGFQAINRRIREGYPFYRASQAFEDRGRTFAAGTVVFPRNSRLALDLKENDLMNVWALAELPQALTVMTPQRIAAYGDPALAHALHELDFEFDMLTQEQLFLGLVDLSGYDVFIHGSGPPLLPASADAVVDFAAGGGDFIGLGGSGVSFAVDHGLIDATAAQEQGNGIVKIGLVAGHPLTSGFGSDDYAFVLTATWFPFVGEGVEVAARLDADSMMVSGYWPDWQTSTAAGMPVMLFSEDDANPQPDTVLIAFDTTFHGHPRNTFKLIGNAIYSGLDTSLAR